VIRTHVEKCGVAAAILSSFGQVRFRVVGTSMIPTVWPNDVVTIGHVDVLSIRPSQIVLVRVEYGFVLHRVVRCDSKSLTSRGDSVGFEDPPVGLDQVLGRLIEIERGGVSLKPPGRLGLPSKLIRYIVCRSRWSRSVMVRAHALRWRVRKALLAAGGVA